jgi:hypothetical protein
MARSAKPRGSCDASHAHADAIDNVPSLTPYIGMGSSKIVKAVNYEALRAASIPNQAVRRSEWVVILSPAACLYND